METPVHNHQRQRMPDSFCPKCGESLVHRLVKYNEPKRLVCSACDYILFLDPKVVAGAIFTMDDQVGLLRRGIEPAMGQWVFPSGYVDRGESATTAAIRETKEESALDVTIRHLLGVYSYTGSPNIIIVYVADIVGGTFGAGDESTEAVKFPVSEIPWNDLAFQSTADALRDFAKLYYPKYIC